MSLTIILDNNSGPPQFNPGDEISGYVLVELDEPKYCRRIEIVLQGKAIVRIVKSDKHKRNFKTIEATEDYVNEAVTLLEDKEITKSSSKFPFTFDLPEDIPCSFVGTHGLVKYSLTACMICTGPSAATEARCNLTLIIQGFLDLNECPVSKEFGPTEVIHEFQGGWCCFRGKRDISVQMTIPKRVATPGEALSFQILVENNSCSDLMSFTVQLVRTATCKAKNKDGETAEVSKSKVMDQVAGPAVPKKTSQEVDIENFCIPTIRSLDLPPSGLGGGGKFNFNKNWIIDVQYSLKVSMFVEQGCCDGSVVFSVPILIGTVPLDLD